MKLTIGRKITAGFLLIVLVFTITSLYSFFMIKNIVSNYSELINKRAKTAILAQNIKAIELEKVASFRGYIINGDTKKLNRIDECEKELSLKKTEIEGLLVTEEGKNAFSTLLTANEENNNLMEKVKLLVNNNQQDEINKILSGEGVKVVDNIINSADMVSSLAQNLLDNGKNEQAQRSHDFIRNTMLLVILTIVMSLLMAFGISAIISKPIIKLSQVAEKIALGDLTIEGIKIRNKDEVGNLASSFNKMLLNLRSVVEKVSSSAAEVAASSQELMAGSETATSVSEEISATMQNISLSIENQKESIDSISCSINEMSTGVEQTSVNIQNVNSNVVEINMLSQKSEASLNSVVSQMKIISKNSIDSVDSVKSLGEMSKKVEGIIELITGISTQTNLLALNAAIEAARAGEHGRGFSVVAEEVRKLAEQSNSATVEVANTIKNMNEQIEKVVSVIESGVIDVNAGVQVVDEVNHSFGEISKGFEDILAQVMKVSAASQEIASGTEEVVTSTDTIVEAVNRNTISVQDVTSAVEEQSATMEEITNKATALAKLAQELDNTVGIFKINK